MFIQYAVLGFEPLEFEPPHITTRPGLLRVLDQNDNLMSIKPLNYQINHCIKQYDFNIQNNALFHSRLLDNPRSSCVGCE